MNLSYAYSRFGTNLQTPTQTTSVGGRYRHIYTANVRLERRETYTSTHIYLCYWHVSTCTDRIDKQKPEIGETWQERRFREGIISKEGKEAQPENKTWANPHHHRSPNLAGSPQREGEDEPGQPRRGHARGAATSSPLLPGPSSLWRFGHQ
jgi:hypothetical protein